MSLDPKLPLTSEVTALPTSLNAAIGNILSAVELGWTPSEPGGCCFLQACLVEAFMADLLCAAAALWKVESAGVCCRRHGALRLC